MLKEGLLGILAMALVLGFIVFIHHAGKFDAIRLARERAALQGFAEYEPRTGKFRWIDPRVCAVVEPDECDKEIESQ